jgi:hypothetical protein
LGIALAAPEYSIVDRINFFRGLWYGWTRVYSQLGDLDYERSASRLRVPVELFLSHDDITVLAAPAERWLSNLEAPTKRVTWFDGFSHGLVYESGPAFVDAMVDVAKRHGALKWDTPRTVWHKESSSTQFRMGRHQCEADDSGFACRLARIWRQNGSRLVADFGQWRPAGGEIAVPAIGAGAGQARPGQARPGPARRRLGTTAPSAGR